MSNNTIITLYIMFKRFSRWSRYEGDKNQQNVPHGKGTLCHYDNTVKYSGDWCDGLYHGKGKLYSSTGVLTYDGEFDKGDKKGKGVGSLYYNPNTGKIDGSTIGRLYYDGELLDGVLKHGKGKYYGKFNFYYYYEADFKDDQVIGKRTIYDMYHTLVAEPSSEGYKVYAKNKLFFEGTIDESSTGIRKPNLKNGTMYCPDGTIIKGTMEVQGKYTLGDTLSTVNYGMVITPEGDKYRTYNGAPFGAKLSNEDIQIGQPVLPKQI
jgi:hypothetical protein